MEEENYFKKQNTSLIYGGVTLMKYFFQGEG